MATNLFRIIKYGLQGFWRNGWLSAATIVLMIMTLVVFEGLIIFNMVANTAVNALKDKIDISVYFKTNVSEDEIMEIEKSLKDLAEVKNTEYISRDRALIIFKEKHQDNPTITQAMEELNENPLLASINIKANDPTEYSVIAAYLENGSFKDLLEKVTYSQNELVINRLAKIVDTLKDVGWTSTFLLALIAVLITFNTIRLAIYSNREEIGIMRLVGASNKFIRGPYLVQGIIYGIFAGFLSVIVAVPFIYLCAPYIQVFIPEMNLRAYFFGNFATLLEYQLLFGIILGLTSSAIAIGRYLKK